MAKNFLGLSLHLGRPALQYKLRAWKCALLSKDRSTDDGLNEYMDHQVRRWCGVAYKRRWFIGVLAFGETTFSSERGPLPVQGHDGTDCPEKDENDG